MGMQVVAVTARKGGVGKTTISMHLSVLAAQPGRPALLIDIDPQRSLAWWHRQRGPDEPRLIEADARELPELIDAAQREGFGRVIIDTPPHAEDSILAAMRAADLVLVPTRPGPLDLAAVASTLDLAQRVGKAPLAAINHAPARTGAAEPAIVSEARAALIAMGATVAGSVLANRVAMSHAILTGSTVNEHEPGGKAAAEVAALWQEIEATLSAREKSR
jgi:chromosome partitioning protein